jgi:hypothetical protein
MDEFVEVRRSGAPETALGARLADPARPMLAQLPGDVDRACPRDRLTKHLALGSPSRARARWFSAAVAQHRPAPRRRADD